MTSEKEENFDKDLREVIRFANVKNMEIHCMFTPDLPSDFPSEYSFAKEEKRFGVRCYNSRVFEHHATTHKHKSCPLNLGVACCICQPHGCPITTPQQQPEEEHEKFEWKNCERCGLQYGLHSPSDGHLFVGAPYANTTPQQTEEEHKVGDGCFEKAFFHPQQTEQWMEDFDRKWDSGVFGEYINAHGNRDEIKSFIQITVASAYHEIQELKKDKAVIIEALHANDRLWRNRVGEDDEKLLPWPGTYSDNPNYPTIKTTYN